MGSKLFIYEKGKETVADQLANYLHQIADEVKIEMDKNASISMGFNKKPNTIKSVSSIFGSMMASLDSYYPKSVYRNNNDDKTEDGIMSAIKVAKEKLDSKLEECEQIHKENIPLLEENRELRKAIIKFMESINIPQTYSTWEYPRSSSRNKKEVKHTAGWVTDMQRVIIIDDGYSVAQSSYKSYLERINKYEKEEIKKIKDKAAAELKAKLTSERTKILSILIARYGLPYETNSFNIIKNRVSLEDSMIRLHEYFKREVDNKRFYDREDLIDELDLLKMEYKEYVHVTEDIKKQIANGNINPLTWTSKEILDSCKNEIVKTDYLTCIKYIENE